MTLAELFVSQPRLRLFPRRIWAATFCIRYAEHHGEAPPITALLCCGIGTEYARKIRSDLINRGVIRPRTSCVREWERTRELRAFQKAVREDWRK